MAYGEAGTDPWKEVPNTTERQGTRKAEGKPPAALPGERTTAIAQFLA